MAFSGIRALFLLAWRNRGKSRAELTMKGRPPGIARKFFALGRIFVAALVDLTLSNSAVGAALQLP